MHDSRSMLRSNVVQYILKKRSNCNHGPSNLQLPTSLDTSRKNSRMLCIILFHSVSGHPALPQCMVSSGIWAGPFGQQEFHSIGLAVPSCCEQGSASTGALMVQICLCVQQLLHGHKVSALCCGLQRRHFVTISSPDTRCIGMYLIDIDWQRIFCDFSEKSMSATKTVLVAASIFCGFSEIKSNNPNPQSSLSKTISSVGAPAF